MRSPSAILTCVLAISFLNTSCTTAKKKLAGTDAPPSLPAPLSTLQPVSDETIASLKAISESPGASLPPVAESESTGSVEDSSPGSPDKPTIAFTVPDSWRGPGLDPDEVNPGDIFSENEGPVLRKVFSLLDELPPSERSTLLSKFTDSKRERVPVTISRTEIAELEKTSPDPPLPSRSVALDFRSETHAIETSRHADLLSGITRGDSSGAITSGARLARLGKQLETVKKRLRSGEKLYIVTAVAESSEIDATYPGAPIGKRDAELVLNALKGLFPHLRSLEARKEDEAIKITGEPRILWEFDTREVKLAGDKIAVDYESVVRL